jgi:hypothetical protein
MSRPALEVADLIRTHQQEFLDRYGPSLSARQKRVLTDLAQCRTEALGGHVQRCDACGYERPAFNSCRNRHCPKCQGGAQAQWLADREQELLPVPYFHVVFTLPHQLGPLALQNPRLMYNLLFQAAAQTLLQVAADPKHLGARIGFLAVLHTWGQKLMHHPHVHCVVPGGGISPEGDRWIGCQVSRRRRKAFFLPVKILSRVFRGKFLQGLRKAYERGELEFHGQLKPLADREHFEQLIEACVRKDWVVYAKRPFAGPRQVLKYLSRYTHRAAISNHRLIRVKDDRVEFFYKDYADKAKRKVLSLCIVEFLRRFLLHVLPARFTRIRYYGWLGNRDRGRNLQLCRQLLGETARPPIPEAASAEEPGLVWLDCCPACGQGRMIVHLTPPAVSATLAAGALTAEQRPNPPPWTAPQCA